MVHIALADTTEKFGGAFRQALHLIDSISAAEDLRLSVISPREDIGSHLPPRTSFYVAQSALNAIRAKTALGKFLSFSVSAGSKYKELRKILRTIDPDIVHLNNLLNSQVAGAFSARCLGAKVVCTHRDFEYPSKLLPFASRTVDQHVAVSYAVKRHLEKCGIRSDRIEVIYDGVDTQAFSPSIPMASLGDFGIKPGGTFGIFGRLVPWKGHVIFLHMAKEVLSRSPESQAVVIGDAADGEVSYEVQLKELAVSLGIGNRVHFLGYQKDVAALMSAVDVVVHLSARPEPFGLVVIEAMACGKPVLSVSEGAPTEIIRNGVDGFLVPPRDPASAADTLIKLLEDRELREKIGQAARARVEENFSAERCVDQYLSLYRRMLRESK